MSILCENCKTKRAVFLRPKNGSKVCKECFIELFEEEVHETIQKFQMFEPKEKIGIGASGGKDSTALIHVLTKLKEKYKYENDFVLISIDEGIHGYRDDSLETVKRNQLFYNLPLEIVSFKDLFGWSLDDIILNLGPSNSCSYCGILRRQALDLAAQKISVKKLATGHNANDAAETVLLNFLRGDSVRISRSSEFIINDQNDFKRCKPFIYAYQKEIVAYAYFNKLDYFSTECPYAVNALRGKPRIFLNDLERVHPSGIIDIIDSGQLFALPDSSIKPKIQKCQKCGAVSSQNLCQACILLEKLNKSKPKIEIEIEKK
ncbi:cytoplasmic tRNA 2-thiolation protein [Anaeramoeba ignava]|uniref:Cytoplasmic tRNA 2-thiolation protein 1 n=1 Tax=Anaeramoeba ignava TaxID=1746090 RepID=A0A9Q0LIV2_ANAIG|nr:cytoplasmic tRNA 2-thiolation protein [Anaeramoeba ignava]